ncbi:hypothetical protein ADK70_02610 [Streptomyces rimosus subsp. pseudoverticillatus]|uniref:hypothetical protein n=1 Tax=Streptomyces rimosus TaxID=1927 RepID=UPI0006B28812|nr:hypothetical protein [Streptomyces rimosus]KOT99792.1 hypothetical protein ADK70_02610 [Streptomyces rimosus subsp. pseudoverticillatus]
MRIQLTWPNTVVAGLTLTFALPDVGSGSLCPVLAGAVEGSGAGLLARLMLPLAVRSVQRSLEGPTRMLEHGPGAPSALALSARSAADCA